MTDTDQDEINGWDLDLFTDEELENTPDRIDGFQDEWRDLREYEKFTVFDNPGYDQIVLLRDIEFQSVCSHHLLPFVGRAHVGYIPDEKIIGISKLARAVDKFASKPQVQEQLTQDVADFLDERMGPLGLMVVVEGRHQCMTMRGVEKQNAVMTTSALKGWFRDPPDGLNPREEFLTLIDREGL